MDDTAISTRFLTADKRRGAPARLQYTQITPLTGTSAAAGETIRWKLPSNRIGVYADFDFSFIEMKLTVAGQTGNITLNMSGIGGLFKQVVVRNAGSHLSDINQYDVWRNIHFKESVTPEFLSNDGSIIMGTKNSDEGLNLSDGTALFCDFLPNLSSVFQVGKYVPLFSADGLELDIVTGSADFGFLSSLTAGGTVSFSDMKLHLATVEVAPEIDRAIISEHDGVFKYLLNNSGHFVTTIPSGSSMHNFNIGASYSSLNKLDFVLVNPAFVATKHDFTKSSLKKATLLIDGNPIIYTQGQFVGSAAVNLTYSRGSMHMMADQQKSQNYDAVDYMSKGYIVSFDLETLVGKSETLRSGVNVSASTLQLVLEFSTATTLQLTCHCFAYYDALMSMDVAGTRQFEISI